MSRILPHIYHSFYSRWGTYWATDYTRHKMNRRRETKFMGQKSNRKNWGDIFLKKDQSNRYKISADGSGSGICMPDDDYEKCKVVAVQLKKLIPNAVHRSLISRDVIRLHRIVIDTTELMSLHITRCLEKELPLPIVDQNYYKLAMMEVTCAKKDQRRKVDDELHRTRTLCMSSLQPVSRQGLDQLMMAQSISLASSFRTNISMHFRKRILRYVRLIREKGQPSDAAAKKMYGLQTLKAAADISGCNHVSFESDPELHAWVREMRRRIGTDDLLYHPESFQAHESTAFDKIMAPVLLKATWRLNRMLEDIGASNVACCPVRRSLVPRFVSIDTTALKQILHVGCDAYTKQRRVDARKRAQWIAMLQTKRPHADEDVRELRRKQLSRPEVNALHSGLHAFNPQIIAIQTWWRRRMCRSMAKQLLCAKRSENSIKSAQGLVRGWILRNDLKKKRKVDFFSESKTLVWNDVICLDKSVLKHNKQWDFAHSIRTDGVSARVLFRPRENRKRKRREETKLETLPKRGIFAIDTIKHLSRQEMQLVGADPGKRELLVCVDADAPPGSNSHRDNGRKYKKPSVRYTRAQREHDCGSKKHSDQERCKRGAMLEKKLQELANTRSSSSYLKHLQKYFEGRRSFLPDALAHFEEELLRQQRWRRFSREQKSITDFVARIRGMQRDQNIPVVLSYGSWSNIAGRSGAACNKGIPPCIGVGLRRKLSQHFLILVTPEYNTSKTCSLCGSSCRECAEVDVQFRTRLLAKADTDEKRRRAERATVRGLRRCQNECCSAYLNRDYNAAINIQRRCKIILGDEPVAPLSDMDGDFERLRHLLEQEA